nr:hypothetical protein [Anaerolineae bacterium]
RLTDALTEKGYKFTRIGTTSGLSRISNVTLLVGVESAQVEEVVEIIRANCRSRTQLVSPPPPERPRGFPPLPPVEKREMEFGGAVIFVLDVKRFERL